MRALFLIISSLFMWISCLSQDNHYSLYDSRYGSLNPALTGLNQKDGEVRSLYRTQWNAVAPISYLTLEAEKQDDLWGYGLNWNKNSAGVGTLVTNQITLGASRQVNLSKSGFLRFGLQFGYYSHNLDWEGAKFESQFNSSGTESTENGEQLTLGKSSSVDLSSGLYYSTLAGPNRLNIGFSIFHLAKNKLSLYSDGSELLRSKKSFHSNLILPRENNWSIIPNVLYQTQGSASESILSIKARKKLEREKSIGFGIGMRLKDAIIFQTEFQLENLAIALAYDVNTSKLKTASNGFGAFEIGLVFKFSTPKGYDETVNLRMVDSDNDGIADESDHCPDLPGNAANKGCPGRADSDGDGIVDEVDLCPGIAGSSIHGGCPDSDGDGVADIDDECPTIYGALHFQGCPDSDQDGISDKYDACPVTFGLITNKGCPDSKSVQPTLRLGEYIVKQSENEKHTTVLPIEKLKTNHKHSYTPGNRTQNVSDSRGGLLDFNEPKSEGRKALDNGEVLENLIVFFESNESSLDFLDKKRLKDFAFKLNSNSDLKLVLKGHTDEDGSDLYNMELGYRRAESVKRYLSQFGITGENILSLSYGEEAPMSVVQDQYSNAQNRRVEIILIK